MNESVKQYKIKAVQTSVEIGNLEDFTLPTRGNALVQCISEMKLINNREIPKVSEDILEMRIFDENQEYYVFKRNGKWQCRYRRDAEGNETNTIDTAMKLRGNMAKKWDEQGNNLHVYTRNYIAEDAFGYNDFRILTIKDGGMYNG